MKLQTRRKHAAESPLGSTNAIGCLEQLHAPPPGVGNSPRRRTARPCESSLGTSSVEQRGAACTWSQTSEPSKSFLAPAHPDLMLRRRVTRYKAHVLPSARGSSPRAPSSHAQHPSCLHRKAGLAPAKAEMRKEASFCEPARQSGCVLMLPVAAGRRVGCRKRHSLESARPLSPSCSISVGQRATRAPMNLADQLQGDACGLSPEALHPRHTSGGFGHPTDSFGRSAPNLSAASRSATKLSARFPSPAAGVR